MSRFFVLVHGADAASARDFGLGAIVLMTADWVFYREESGTFDFKPTAPAQPGR